MADLGTLMTSLGADLGPLNRSVTQARGAFHRYQQMGVNTLNRVKRSVFSLQGAFVALGASLVVKKFIDTNAAFEQMELKLNALTKGKGVETLERINKWAMVMPVNTRKAVDTFAMMKAMGLDPTIKSMEILVDTSVLFGEEAMPRIARALGQMQTLGRLSAEELNQLSEAGINARKYLTEAFGTATAQEINKSGVAIEKVIAVIMKGLEEDFGGAARQAMNTWQGVTATFESSIMEIERQFGKAGVFDAIKTAIQSINTELTGWLENQIKLKDMGLPNWFDRVAETAQSLADKTKNIHLYLEKIWNILSYDPDIVKFGLLGLALWGKKGAALLGGLAHMVNVVQVQIKALQLWKEGIISFKEIATSNFQELKELVEKGERLLTPPFFKGKIPSLPKPEGMSSPPSPETSGEAGVKSYSKEYENTLKELARKQADFEFEIRQLDRNTYEQKRQEIYRWATTLEEELSKSGDLTTQMQQQIASTAKVQLDLLGAERTKEEISKRVKAIADGLQKEEELHKQYQTDVVEFLMSEEEHIRDSYARRIKIVNEHVQNQEKATRLIKQLHEKMNEDIADLGKKTFGEDLENAITGWASHFSGELNDMLWNAEMTFGNIAESFAKMITQMIIQKQIVEPLVSDFGGWMSDIFPFAKGGVINHPTVFPMAKGYGLAGEAGSEAILPLARIGGDLGVKAATGDVNVYIENNSSAEGRVEGTNRNAQGGLDIFVKIDEMTAANIRSPGKRTHKALRETFGARPVVMGR